MNTAIAITKGDPGRRVLLEEYEKKIGGALRRGLDATVVIGNALKKIDELELYEDRECKNLAEYCQEYHGWDIRTAHRFMSVATSVALLKDHRMELPDNETQVCELTRLEPEDQPVVWQRVKLIAEQNEVPVTVELVRKVVDHQIKEAAPATTAKDGSRNALDEPDLDLGSDLSNGSPGSSGGPTLPSRVQLSEEGERDLERIRRLCGEQVAQAIEKQVLQISERELKNWAAMEDPSELIHYVVDLRWTVAKAMGFVNQTITERTPVGRLLILARANGGHYVTEADNGKITVDVPV